MRIKITKAGTRRTLRTIVQLGGGAAVAAPILATQMQGTPVAAQLATFAAAVAVVARAWTALEDAGVIPAWLRDDVPADGSTNA